MNKKMSLFKIGLITGLVLAFSFSLVAYNVSASDIEEAFLVDDSDFTLILSTNATEGNDEVDLDEFSESELLEPEPSDLPNAEKDQALSNRLSGSLLLDVEGNGEVYYVDPESQGKEYLADGAAAHRLLERRALGINESNFSKLELGSEVDESNVCSNSVLADKLKGKIVLRVESHGEAYWINPNNCRAYYTGTYEAAYNLMKKMSLGIKKVNLAKIEDNVRQKTKTALRYSVYAYAAENEVDLKQAKEDVKSDLKDINECLKIKQTASNQDLSPQRRITLAKECSQGKVISSIKQEQRNKIKEAMEVVRESNREITESKDSEENELEKERPSLGEIIRNIVKPGIGYKIQ
jgi:hypothetical protein